MAFTTKASRITYKIFPSASSTNPDTLFSTADGWAKVNANGYSQSFLNYPGDTYTGFTTVTGTTTYPTTRVTSSTYPTISVAFPWGSMAGDFLWNCLTPSWSYQTTSGYHTWSYTQTSESFNYRNDRNGTSFGTRLYNITSSWEIYNRKLYANDAITPVTFSFEANQTSTYPVPDISNYTYALDYPTGELVEYGFFDQSGGIGITKAAVSNSMESQSIGLTPAARFEGLKKRRLFFPIPYSGSGATATDYWLKKYSGLNANDFFDENGGIYNVTFTIKKDASLGIDPDDGTFMSVFIANVRDNVGSYYPPENNIIKIGSNIPSLNIPILSFNTINTFSVNLIQYGYPAQLCFEPSGSRVDETYFGIIIDDISICKIGKTTDPRFIAPLTVGGVIAQNETQNPGGIITE